MTATTLAFVNPNTGDHKGRPYGAASLVLELADVQNHFVVN